MEYVLSVYRLEKYHLLKKSNSDRIGSSMHTIQIAPSRGLFVFVVGRSRGCDIKEVLLSEATAIAGLMTNRMRAGAITQEVYK